MTNEAMNEQTGVDRPESTKLCEGEMRFEQPHCPRCGSAARSTADLIPGEALMIQHDDGSYSYAGETEVDWDGQQPILDLHGWSGHDLLICIGCRKPWISQTLPRCLEEVQHAK